MSLRTQHRSTNHEQAHYMHPVCTLLTFCWTCVCELCTLVCRLYNLAGFFTALASLLSKHGIEDRDYTIDQLNTLRKQACLLFAKVCGSAAQPM